MKLCTIPRCSGNEAAVADTLVQRAITRGFKYNKDTFNNVIVYIPATPGYENEDSVCLQGHVDIVCQSRKNVSTIFPIVLEKSGDTLRSKDNTSIGADDGVGVGSMMVFMQPGEPPHPYLELLFTSGEEEGFVGSGNFDYRLIHSKTMYNVDAEDFGAITIGCAGGSRFKIGITPTLESSTFSDEYSLKISGFAGGHSGVDIGLGRANAIVVLSNILADLKKDFDIRLVKVSAGSKLNTIPRDANAVILLPQKVDAVVFQKNFQMIVEKIHSLFPKEKPEFILEKITKTQNTSAVGDKSFEKFLWLVKNLPNGVVQKEKDDTSLVRTSNNIAVVEVVHDTILIEGLFRSSSDSQIDSLKEVIRLVSAGQPTEFWGQYPAWEPIYPSTIYSHAAAVYAENFGNPPVKRITHGGLESALYYRYVPGISIIAFGPSVHNAHTPDEWVEAESIQKYWKFLCALLAKKHAA